MRDTKINHEIIINVETGAYTANPPLDIHQGDDSHVLIIKLRNSRNKPIQLKEGSTAKLSFSREDPERSGVEEVSIINGYRGVLSYIVSPRITREYGRYTCRIDIHDCEHEEDHGPSVTFVINIAKDHNYVAPSTEVVITEEFYDKLNDHLDDENIHVSDSDRLFLDTFSGMVSEISNLLNTDFDSKIDSRVVSKTKSIIAQSFITVDFKSQMTSLSRDEVCEGKIVRVNYGDYYYHDGDPGTIENHPYDYSPEYYVCKLVGNNETIEWHKIDFGGGAIAKINEVERNLNELSQRLTTYQQNIDTRIIRIEDTLSSIDIEEIQDLITGIQTTFDSIVDNLTDLNLEVEEHTQTIVEHTNKIEYSLKWGQFSELDPIPTPEPDPERVCAGEFTITIYPSSVEDISTEFYYDECLVDQAIDEISLDKIVYAILHINDEFGHNIADVEVPLITYSRPGDYPNNLSASTIRFGSSQEITIYDDGIICIKCSLVELEGLSGYALDAAAQDHWWLDVNFIEEPSSFNSNEGGEGSGG